MKRLLTQDNWLTSANIGVDCFLDKSIDYRHFNDESSSGTKDVANILIKRYGLERAFANKEIIAPLKNLKSK